MSKNFELMQQAEIGVAIPPVIESGHAPATGNVKASRHGKGVYGHLGDKLTREEAFQLVQNIFLLRCEAPPRVVTFAGIDPGNGCSWVCAHVAETLANQKVGTVCLVDGNFRSPSLPGFFGVSNHYGLTDALSQSGSIRDYTKVVRSDNLSLLSCGSLKQGASTLLNSEIMKRRMAELRNEFDYVIVDSPPLNVYQDGVSIGQLSDGLVLVLEANSTRREVAAKITENLRATRIKILGAVLNKRKFPIPQSVYDLL